MKFYLIIIVMFFVVGCKLFEPNHQTPYQPQKWRVISDTISCNSIFDLLQKEWKQGKHPASYSIDIDILKIMNEKEKCFKGKNISFIKNLLGKPTRIDKYERRTIYYYWIDHEGERVKLDPRNEKTSFVYSIFVELVKDSLNQKMVVELIHFQSNVY